MVLATTARTREGRKLERVDVRFALANREKNYYCVECGKLVGPFKKGSDGRAAHFEHRKRNIKCSLSHHLARLK
jgi:hypothetical protein